jgi:hypothetical protein
MRRNKMRACHCTIYLYNPEACLRCPNNMVGYHNFNESPQYKKLKRIIERYEDGKLKERIIEEE